MRKQNFLSPRDSTWPPSDKGQFNSKLSRLVCDKNGKLESPAMYVEKWVPERIRKDPLEISGIYLQINFSAKVKTSYNRSQGVKWCKKNTGIIPKKYYARIFQFPPRSCEGINRPGMGPFALNNHMVQICHTGWKKNLVDSNTKEFQSVKLDFSLFSMSQCGGCHVFLASSMADFFHGWPRAHSIRVSPVYFRFIICVLLFFCLHFLFLFAFSF